MEAILNKIGMLITTVTTAFFSLFATSTLPPEQPIIVEEVQTIEEPAPVLVTPTLGTPTPEPSETVKAYELGIEVGKLQAELEKAVEVEKAVEEKIEERITTRVREEVTKQIEEKEPLTTKAPEPMSEARLEVVSVENLRNSRTPFRALSNPNVTHWSEVEGDDVYSVAYIRVKAFDDAGQQITSLTADITTPDSSQNKTVTATKEVEFEYLIKTAGEHDITFTIGDQEKVVTITAE